jgi:hypothetical protein
MIYRLCPKVSRMVLFITRENYSRQVPTQFVHPSPGCTMLDTANAYSLVLIIGPHTR